MAKSCDADMLAKTKELMLKQVDDNAKTNAYWSDLVMDNYMMNLDEHTNYKRIVQALTPESISTFIKEYLKDANKVSVVMLPQE